MKHDYLLALIILPTIAFSGNDLSPFQIGSSVMFSVIDTNELSSEALGYKATLGYNMNKNVLLEVGYGNYRAFTNSLSDITPVLTELKWKIPVSGYASLYVGGGFAFMNSDANPTAVLGINYQLTKHWFAELGYQSIFDIEASQSDLYALNFSFVYRFPTSDEMSTTSRSQ
ncbi:porin family protein [Vibrio genomosp. F10]|uniref:Outer membrane protein beta-barrel domain-containing protein n=1 Tax=Vibrio genomosp. F10 str. ZF-129 TaxID=1187848 RepID=A0A1E5BDM5_9VIBR|nr:porin family protein [Vibrio genomosp. F10]OEE33264.1 hypothetical protein A1QO_09940 [Vibrio genomosp. F10 str. ZF-129]OEF06084.1 hypothetical protein A1QK_08625 [Vibrio genomosp. F10 str. 9ZD137]